MWERRTPQGSGGGGAANGYSVGEGEGTLGVMERTAAQERREGGYGAARELGREDTNGLWPDEGPRSECAEGRTPGCRRYWEDCSVWGGPRLTTEAPQAPARGARTGRAPCFWGPRGR